MKICIRRDSGVVFVRASELSVLDQIVVRKRAELLLDQGRVPLEQLEKLAQKAAQLAPRRGFRRALERSGGRTAERSHAPGRTPNQSNEGAPGRSGGRALDWGSEHTTERSGGRALDVGSEHTAERSGGRAPGRGSDRALEWGGEHTAERSGGRVPARGGYRVPAVIAEIKKASPSRGVIAEQFDPAEIARRYEAGGATALSVLTDQQFFEGALQHLEQARAVTRLPVLRKDFTLDVYHLWQAAAHGADAVLLIVAILSRDELTLLLARARDLDLDALVEVHDREELDRALEAGADLVGVNNRNLRTFEVSLETSLRLAEHIPPQVLAVSESGIRTPEDVGRLAAAGYRAFLVGESLMRSADPGAALGALLAGVRRATGSH